ncbi:MAG: histidine kinase dimerization/phosphoacceptor domain -containing protein [Bacteroidota bacterium]|jgi:PAS domain S-box-containing protein
MVDYETMSRDELIALLKMFQDGGTDIFAHSNIAEYASTMRQQSPDELQRLFQNLRLYQLRLEEQNRELREAQQELEEARNHLADLYDFAPIGYVTLDDKGCIQQINKTGAMLLGMEQASLLDKPFVRFVEKTHARTFLLHLRRCLESDEKVSSELGLDIPEVGTLYVQLSSVRVPDNYRRTFVYRTAMTDITERKKAEEQIHTSLREKEVLLKEVHHRVKNNLQIISSLLKLQSGFVEDKRALELFRESQDIIRSMALIHEKLYRSDDLSSVNYSEYITEVATNLFRSYGINTDAILLSVDVANVAWGLDTAIPVSLIINELISNSLKYAFPNGRQGQISIRLYTYDGMYFTLVVSDNGVGIPEHVDIQQTESLGLQLVAALTDELQGKLTLDRFKGTRFTITFTVEKQGKRNS